MPIDKGECLGCIEWKNHSAEQEKVLRLSEEGNSRILLENRKLREENLLLIQALFDMTKQRDDMGKWIAQDDHDCEFHSDPERGKCDWCEMMGNYFADNNIAFDSEDDDG